jgi:hypothetical protein
MADGTKINAATVTGGDTIDTEQVGSVKLPRSKIALGVRDADDGDVAAGNPMPVVFESTPAVAVSNFPATQPVSAAALPLPAGAAADATLTGGAAKAQPVDASGNVLGTTGHPVRVDPVGTTPQPITAAALPLPAGAALASAQTDGSQRTQVTNFPGTQPVSAVALPLPAGAAVASAQTDGTQKTRVVDAAGHVLPAGDAAARAIVVALSDAISAILGTSAAPLRTDPTGTTTQPISAASLPLPAGAVADATITARLSTLGQKASAASAPVVIASDQSPVPVTGTMTVDLGGTDGLALDATLTGGTAKVQVTDGSTTLGVALHPLRTDPTGTTTQPVSAAALPLPAGAATETTLGTRLADATLTARLGTLGQKTSAGSAPVVLASDQSTVPISAASLPLPAGAALDATVSARLGTLGQKTMAASTPVAIASDQAAVPVSAASLPLPTGAATETTLGTRLADATITARLGTLGQKAMAGAAPVVIASDQSAVPISAASLPLPTGAALDATLTGGTAKSRVTDGTNTAAVKAASTAAAATDPALVVAVSPNNTVPISAASLPLPTGAALDATLTARLGTVGQKAMAGSAPVVIASDQSAVPISAASLPLPTGAALDATLTGGTQKTKVTDGTNTANVKAASTAAIATDPALVVAISPNNTVPISAASLPLPTGAALDATLTGGTAKARITDGTNTAAVKAASTAAAATDPALVVAISPNNTIPISAASLPLPTGAALDATLTGGTQKSKVVDASGNVLPSADVAARALFAKITDGTNTLPTMDVAARAGFQKVTDGTNTAAVKAASTAAAATDPAVVVAISPNNTIPISAASLPLPTGAALDATLTGGTAKARITDGTNTAAVKAASTAAAAADPALVVSLSPNSAVAQGVAAAAASAWPVKLTDGTNTAPTGDVAARAGYERITDGTNTAAVKAASTAALATDPALVVAISPNTPAVPMTLGNAQQTPLSNASVSASSSATYTGIGHKEFNLVVNIKNAPTGTTPTLTFQIQELDPGDQSTAIGAAVVGTALIAAGTQTLKLPDCTTGCVKVTWTIGGTSSPTFTGVYATVSVKPTEDMVEQYAPVAEDNTNGVIAVTLKPLAVGIYAWAVGFSTALAASLIIKAASGVLRSLRVRLDSTAASATYYLQLFNSTTLPADSTGTGSMLVAPVKVQFTTGTDQTVTLDYTDAGIAFSTGLVVVLSSTEFTKTISGAYLSMSALYK